MNMRVVALVLMAALILAVAGCVGATPSAVPTPTPTPGQLTVTLADDGTTITVTVGQSFLLELGEQYNWEVSVADPSIVSRVVNILVVRGAQGVYEAHKLGTTTLTAAGDPLCRQATPPCAAPSRLFTLRITVE